MKKKIFAARLVPPCLLLLALAVLLPAFPSDAEIPALPGKTLGRLRKPLDTGPTPTNTWAVRLPGNADPKGLARRLGLEYLGQVGPLKGYYLLRLPAERARAFDPQNMGKLAKIQWVRRQYKRRRYKRMPTDPLFVKQWHLDNTAQSGGTAGIDINVTPVWEKALRGDGVQIAIVDDGLDYDHPDIAPNYVADDSWDFNDGDADPAHTLEFDGHGTSVAGVAAARDDGLICGVGAAFRASLAGIRLLSAETTDAEEAEALTYHFHDNHIFSNSWGPADDGMRLEGPGPLTGEALAQGVNQGRDGLGSIYVWAAGNGLSYDDNVNYDGFASSRYTIAVGAVDHNGVQSWYSEPGASMLVTAPGSGDDTYITTTDRNACTEFFSGTSATAPLASGVIALMLDANPDLSWSDVQHILVRSTVKNDPLDPGWCRNGAGRWVNHKYGFGMINAERAVCLASSWPGTEEPISWNSALIPVNRPIPDNDPSGISESFTIEADLLLEHVEIIFSATHPYRGDLEILLTSPDGTESVLARKRADSNADYPGWKFTSVRHWGEPANGAWKLRVADTGSGNTGTFDSWQLILHGTERPQALAPGILMLLLSED